MGIQRVGPFLQFDGKHGPAFVIPDAVIRIVTGEKGDALLFFEDGKHEFVKHSAAEVARAIGGDGLQTMRETA